MNPAPYVTRQIVGQVLATNALQAPFPNRYIGLLQSNNGSTTIGTICVDTGATRASFVVNDHVESNTENFKNRVFIVVDDKDHFTRRFFWKWVKYPEVKTTTTTFSGFSIAASPDLQMIGSFKKSTAVFAVSGSVVKVKGQGLNDILLLVTVTDKLPPRCVCERCPIFNFPVGDRRVAPEFEVATVDKWIDVVDKSKFRNMDFLPMKEMRSDEDVYLSCWFNSNGVAVFGRCWKDDGFFRSSFTTAPNKDNGSFQCLQTPNPRMSSFKYLWRVVQNGGIPLNAVSVGDSVVGFINHKNLECICTVFRSTEKCFFGYRGQTIEKEIGRSSIRYLLREPNEVLHHIIRGSDFEFSIEKLIGSGTYGAVYQVHKKGDDENKMAMKVERKRDGKELKIVKEITVLKALQHSRFFPNFVDYGIHKDIHIVVMELLGASLEDVITQSPLPFPKVVKVAKQILFGLRDLHRAGYVHQDIKPANVCFGKGPNSEKIYIIDYGLSRRYCNTQMELRTPYDDRYQGTAEYASIAALSYRDVFPSDDLQNWCYVLIDMAKKLEWNGEGKAEALDAKRLALNATTSRFFCNNHFPSLDAIINYCKDCKRDEEIQYDWIIEMLDKMLTSRRP